jgi:chromatin assembly factor 1 subunit B
MCHPSSGEYCITFSSPIPSAYLHHGRRLTFTPDGALLIIPTGIHRNPLVSQQQGGMTNSKKNSSSSSNPLSKSFCTHIYHREQLLNASSSSMPALSLVGLDEPSVAIRVCPRLFKFIGNTESDSSSSGIRPLFAGNYRMIFAVVTISSVFVYDTQHPYPLVKLSGLHYAAINDAAWTGDGSTLSFCSSDGYVSFVRFASSALGKISLLHYILFLF